MRTADVRVGAAAIAGARHTSACAVLHERCTTSIVKRSAIPAIAARSALQFVMRVVVGLAAWGDRTLTRQTELKKTSRHYSRNSPLGADIPPLDVPVFPLSQDFTRFARTALGRPATLGRRQRWRTLGGRRRQSAVISFL